MRRSTRRELGHTVKPHEHVMMAVEDAQRPYTFVRYVPTEFEDVAVAFHVAPWKSDPIERVAQTPEELALAEVTL